MTGLERAASGSGNIAFSMKFTLGFPAEILSGGGFFPADKSGAAAEGAPEGSTVLFSDIIHPDDYQPFCEVINDMISGTSEQLKVHSRILTGEVYSWFFITGSVRRGENGAAVGADGMMFDVSNYLDCDGEDAVMRRFRSKRSEMLKAGRSSLSLRDIVGEDYLIRIQKPLSRIKGLYSAVVDSDGRTISPMGHHDRINLNKLDYQRKKLIRVRHQTVASWIIAGDSQDVVDENAQLLDIMVQTVSGMANSYVVLVDEMDNSQNANKLLGQNFEDQILTNNVYSLILKSSGTKAALASIIPLISEYFGLSDIVFSIFTGQSITVYRWDESGEIVPLVSPRQIIPSIAEELEYSGIVCTDRNTLSIQRGGENLSCVLVRTYDNGGDIGVILYTARECDRVWSNRERKLLKNLTQILSTVIYKLFVEEELEISRDRLERLAYRDFTTNIPNRSMFERDFDEEISGDKSGAVISIEISNLKTISELYSCDHADDVLKSIAEYVTAVPCDVPKKVYRFSNDILFVVMSGAEREEARQMAQAVLTRLRTPWYLKEYEHHITSYAGVTMYPPDAVDTAHCINAATHALRLAKERRYEDAAFYSEGLEEKLNENLIIKKLISDSAENGFKGFFFLYQPVIDINSGALICCEANLFWGNGDMTVPRARFLPIIDGMGLSKELYRYAVDKICDFSAKVRERGAEEFRVSVNTPANILSNEICIEALRGSLLEYSLPPNAVSVSVSDREGTLTKSNIFLRQLAQMGVYVIADDTADRYFTVEKLENHAIKILKIHSSRFSDDAVSSSFIRSVIDLAHDKGITVCAKGVDNAAAFETVRKFGVDYLQGMFNGRPLRANAFLDKLALWEPVRRSG